MSDLSELYQQVILDHNKSHKLRILEEQPEGEGVNPLCGDQLVVYLDVEDDVSKTLVLRVRLCISKAAASMMTQSVKGKTRKRRTLFEEFHQMVTGELDEEATPNTWVG